MRNDFYPGGTVQALLETNLVLPQTKKVLQERLDTPVVSKPSFFSEKEFQTLQAVCNCLLPQPTEREKHIDVAGIFDANVKEGRTQNGWRYDNMPPDEKAFTQGLQAIEQSSQSYYGKAFYELNETEQNKLLTNVQTKNIDENIWQQLPSDLFFTELLASLVEIYYSHPAAKDEIGDVSMADAEGWHRIQLNQLETQEPTAIHTKSKDE